LHKDIDNSRARGSWSRISGDFRCCFGGGAGTKCPLVFTV
jgi:hypothetical protein